MRVPHSLKQPDLQEDEGVAAFIGGTGQLPIVNDGKLVNLSTG